MHFFKYSIRFASKTSNEITSIVNKLAPKSSIGFDKISVKLIKRVINYLSIPLSKIYNNSLAFENFLDLLKLLE